MLTEKDLIFASLMGVNNVGMYQRTQIVQDEMAKKYIPRIPFLPLRQEEKIVRQEYSNGINQNPETTETPENSQFFPLSFSFHESGMKWVFPFEPMISISGGNDITKRNVSHKGTDKNGNLNSGTIKERTRRKDFEIIITGILSGANLKGKPEDCFPVEDLRKLLKYLKDSKEIHVYCYPLEILGINKIVIEDYKFPFTKGENLQAYEINAVSDFPTTLIVTNQD